MHVLVLGATTRLGQALLHELAWVPDVTLTAGILTPSQKSLLPAIGKPYAVVVADPERPAQLHEVCHDIDVVVVAAQPQQQWSESEWAHWVQQVAYAVQPQRVIVPGHAGALWVGEGQRFCQDPAVPRQTVALATAQAQLCDALQQDGPTHWAYVVPPPFYAQEGLRTGVYQEVPATADDSWFLQRHISHDDFVIALRDAVLHQWQGVYLVSNRAS